jgi:hypothetical protein
MSEFVEEIVEAFRPQFAACEALLDFARSHRPEVPPPENLVARLLHRTYVRGSKTFQAAYLLAGRGYGVQAGMLNRALYEDMLVAHWVKLNPESAPDRYGRHRLLSVERMRGSMKKHKVGEEFLHLPVLTRQEREEYAQEFGNRSWTGLSLDEIATEVQTEWGERPLERDLFWWVFDIAHRFNNLLLHHSAIGLGLAAEHEDEELVRLDVGPSKTHIHGALFVSFYSYAHLMSLVQTEEDQATLNDLYSVHLDRAFLKDRDPPPEATDENPMESDDGEERQTEPGASDRGSATSAETGSKTD